MNKKAIQDYYPDEVSHCYACGRLNEQGLHLKSYWEGEESVAVFHPESYHIALPGFVYGGLLASIVDCHGTATAAAGAYHAEGREMGTEPSLRFVTASLKVDFVRPTPLGVALEVRGRVLEIKGRKAITEVTIAVGGEVCVKGKVVAVKMPQHMAPPGMSS